MANECAFLNICSMSYSSPLFLEGQMQECCDIWGSLYCFLRKLAWFCKNNRFRWHICLTKKPNLQVLLSDLYHWINIYFSISAQNYQNCSLNNDPSQRKEKEYISSYKDCLPSFSIVKYSFYSRKFLSMILLPNSCEKVETSIPGPDPKSCVCAILTSY